MNRRHLLAPLVLLALAATAGCIGIFGPPPVDKAALAEDANYKWNTSRAAYLEVHESNYTAVYRVEARSTGQTQGNATIELYTRDALGTEQPLQFSALQFRFPNGTLLRYERTTNMTAEKEARVIRIYRNGTQVPAPGALAVERTRKRTVVHLPKNDSGKLGLTVAKNGKSVSTPTFVTGSYEMVLPQRARIGVPLLAQIRPQRDDVKVVKGHRHLIWTEVTAPSITVRYYLDRDLLIFAGLAGILSFVGLLGAGYYLLQIRETVRKREEVGIDVEVPDDDRDGPPPGMR